MRRIARILGLIGGLGAILWAMRERLVSVAIPREPQLPAFRVPDTTPPTEAPSATATADAPTGTPVTDVSGIGPVYATRLAAAGINSIEDLAGAEVEAVAQAAAVPTGRASSWVETARDLAG